MSPLLPLFKEIKEFRNDTFSYGPKGNPQDSGIGSPILPSDFRLLDISKDSKFVAFVDNDFCLKVHCLAKNAHKELVPVKDPIITRDLDGDYFSDRNMYMFLSVASETGYAAVSSLKINKEGDPIYGNERQDSKNNFKGCKVFRKNQEDVDIGFYGRAVFVEDKLVMVNTDNVYVHRRWSYSLLDIHKGIPELVHVNGLNSPKVIWACTNIERPSDNGGQKIINMTQLIKDGFLMTFYSNNVTKVWSLFEGSLITSIFLGKGESVMAISEDKLYLATYNNNEKRVKIYDTETLLILHSYKPRCMKQSHIESTITAIKFCPNQHYLFLAGAKSNHAEASNGNRKTFFEVWLIEKERCISYQEQENTFIGSPFPDINILNESKRENRLTNRYVSTCFTTKFEGLFAEKLHDKKEMKIEEIPIFEEEREEIKNKNILWDQYECKQMGTKIAKGRGKFYEITAPLDEADGLIYYLLDDLYVLRFGRRTVQLWELTPMDDEGKDEDAFKFPNQVDGRKKYNKSIDKSKLLFIRAHKGHHAEFLSNFKDVWKITKPSSPRIDFMSSKGRMSDKGRIMVDIEQINHNRVITDEFFLPLPGLHSDSSNDFDEIESLSQALYCLCNDYKISNEDTCATIFDITQNTDNINDSNTNSQTDIVEKTSNLLKEKLSDNKSNYFKTKSGNRTLAMLASFKEGFYIFQYILMEKCFPMTIYSFPTADEDNENFLTILIKKNHFNLFELLFNEILYEYHQKGTNNLFPLMDTLSVLKDVKIQGLLLKCTQKLSDVEINLKHSGLIETEYHTKFSYSSIYHFTKIQQLKKYHSKLGCKLFYKITGSNRPWSPDKELRLLQDKKDSLGRRTALCIIPLPSYNVYNVFSYGCSVEDDAFSRSAPKGEKPEKNFHTLNVIEVLIDQKWRDSARDGLFGILAIHLVYYVFYSIGVSFPEEFFGYIPGTPIHNSAHLVCIAIMIITGAFLFFQETIQMKAWRLSYFQSIFNYVDLAAFFLPLTTLVLLIKNHVYLYEVSSVTVLILWVHFVLRLRVIPTIGTLSEIILRLAKKFFPILFALIMVVVAFTHAFIILLRRKDDVFFQEKYEGRMTVNNDSSLLNGASMTLSDESQQNPFKDVFMAFTTVWFFISGSFDPVFSGDVTSNAMVTILAILFSFCTGLIVLNVVIALMTGAIESTKKKGNRNWYIHYIAVVAEIELFWGLFFKKNDPIYVYYWTFNSRIKEKCDEFEKDIEKLRSSLSIKKPRIKKCSIKHHSTE